MSRPGDDPTHATTELTSATVERLHQARHGEGISLLVYHRDGGRLVPLATGASIVVGRLPPADVILSDVSLSREHARFTLEEGTVIVEDLGSTNGTLLRGQSVERESLRPGDEVTLGAVTVSVHSGALHAGHRDVMGHERFREALEADVERARFFRRPLSVLLLRAERGRERPLRAWGPQVQSQLRRIDRMGVYSEDAVFVLLPEVSADESGEIARALISACAADVSLVCGTATFPDAATSAEELLGECLSAARRANALDRVIAPAQGRGGWLPAPAPAGVNSVVVESPAMLAAVQTAKRIAPKVIPILLYGETGTGKEVMARLIHESSSRAAKPLVCVNCAAIPAALVESTLFGHEKGSFTGAHAQHKGVFEAAHGGTVFLDEIGELPAAAQAALLRVLETKQFARVGATKEIAVDVRTVGATHRDLEAMVQEGSFREDLYYRLNTVTIKVPPLRERKGDIVPLAMQFLAMANGANETDVRAVETDALEALTSYAWPGNVRELKNVIERGVAITESETISLDDLPERVRSAKPVHFDGQAGRVATGEPPTRGVAGPPTTSSLTEVRQLEGDFRSRMERLEAEVLRGVLLETGWNQTEAARRLSMPVRTFFYKVKMHGIKKPTGTGEGG